MAYYVDTGDGYFTECATIAEAREVAQGALQSAQDFRDRMGWTPYWGRCVEIRKGKPGLVAPRWVGTGEMLNQAIVAATKTHNILYLKETPQ